MTMPETHTKFVFLQNILNWPEVTTWVLTGIALFFLIMFFIYFFTKRHYTATAKEEANWHIIMNYGAKRGLITRELVILKEFYLGVNPQEREELIFSKKKLHSLFQDYLKERSGIDPEKKVELIEKLFPRKEYLKEVKDTTDIYEGEICALEIDNKHYLANIMKIDRDELLLSVEHFQMERHTTNSHASIYIYRPSLGGFLLQSVVKALGDDSVNLLFGGLVEEKGDIHLMAEIDIEVKLTPWPTPEDEELLNSHTITGTIMLLSDRMFSMTSDKEDEMNYLLKHHDLWQCKYTLPVGYNFSCRGTLALSHATPESYIFTYLDASEQARNIVFAEIQAHSPVREKII